jgi:hypothetical protein
MQNHFVWIEQASNQIFRNLPYLLQSLHLSCFETTGADGDGGPLPFSHNLDALQIRNPPPLGEVMSMTHRISIQGFLSTNLAYFSHLSSFSSNQICRQRREQLYIIRQ